MTEDKDILDVIVRDKYIIEVRTYDIPQNNIDNVYRTAAELLYNQAVKSA